MSKTEMTPGGSIIVRHDGKISADNDIGHADDERISAHIKKHIHGDGTVFHEIVSDLVHIDVHLLPPCEKYPFQILVTSGMSAYPMNMPSEMEGSERWQYAELCLFLPKDWPLSEDAFRDEKNYWPVRMLKNLARFPHTYQTWLGWGHSVPNGNPVKRFVPETEMAGALILPPVILGPQFFEVPGDPVLHIFQVVPITEPEMIYKLEKGTDSLLELLEKKFGDDIYGPIDCARKGAVPTASDAVR